MHAKNKIAACITTGLNDSQIKFNLFSVSSLNLCFSVISFASIFELVTTLTAASLSRILPFVLESTSRIFASNPYKSLNEHIK